VTTGPWDPMRAGTPGRDRFLASDADRERTIDALKTAFVEGVLTKDELAVRTGHALSARTYGHIAAITADLAARRSEASRAGASRAEASRAGAHRAGASSTEARQPAKTAKTAPAPVHKRLNKKVVAWGACAIVLPAALAATFFTFYGGFLVIFLLTFIGTVITSKSPAPRRPGPAPMSGRQ
jgi:hypothetical protein